MSQPTPERTEPSTKAERLRVALGWESLPETTSEGQAEFDAETRVFDHTAIIALFQGSTPAFRVWEAAEDDKLTLILPAVAVAEANGVVGADSNAWRAILDPGRVVVTPLDESTAIEVGRPRAASSSTT
jgi:hypothetical protein